MENEKYLFEASGEGKMIETSDNELCMLHCHWKGQPLLSSPHVKPLKQGEIAGCSSLNADRQWQQHQQTAQICRKSFCNDLVRMCVGEGSCVSLSSTGIVDGFKLP